MSFNDPFFFIPSVKVSSILRKMKSMINNNNHNNENNDDNKNSNNWLGFSLSPHMNVTTTTSRMEGSPPSDATHPSSSSNPTTYFNLPSHFNYPNLYCPGVEGENGSGLYSGFPIMPLKSDGSLCLMEAITRSQSQGLFLVFFCGAFHYLSFCD